MLRQGVQGISDIITVPGLINLDFADVRTIMRDAGSALMGIGRASGENRAVEAAQQAIASPLLEVNINGAQGILFNITGSSNLSLYEVTEAAEEIRASGRPGGQHHLRDELQRAARRRGHDHGHRDRLRRQEAPRPAVARRHGVARHGPSARSSRASATSSRSSSASATSRRPRDGPGSRGSPTSERGRDAAPRVERSVGEAPAQRRAATYDAEDLEIPSFLRRK